MEITYYFRPSRTLVKLAAFTGYLYRPENDEWREDRHLWWTYSGMGGDADTPITETQAWQVANALRHVEGWAGPASPPWLPSRPRPPMRNPYANLPKLTPEQKAAAAKVWANRTTVVTDSITIVSRSAPHFTPKPAAEAPAVEEEVKQ